MRLFFMRIVVLHHLYFHRSPKKERPNFSRTVFRNSGLVSATSGKSFIHSYGLQASIIAREFIRAVEPAGIMGSRELDQHRRMMSMSVAGSHRVDNAQTTSSMRVGSISSSTTTVKRF